MWSRCCFVVILKRYKRNKTNSPNLYMSFVDWLTQTLIFRIWKSFSMRRVSPCDRPPVKIIIILFFWTIYELHCPYCFIALFSVLYVYLFRSVSISKNQLFLLLLCTMLYIYVCIVYMCLKNFTYHVLGILEILFNFL